MPVTKLARVYAKALLDLAVEQNQLSKVREEIGYIKSVLNASPDLERALGSPVVKDDQKRTVFSSIFKEALGELTLRFADLLIRQGRGARFQSIFVAFEEAYLKHMGIRSAVVTTAYELSAEEEKAISEKLAQLSGQEIQLEKKIDQDMIGGMILRMGDRQYNGSVAAELKRLRREFKTNQYISEL
ncbi:MAG: ATP synthase F1 subunit delta [Schleiferiaceae bacterium]|nr:ATP synthase F1 subunit delta [Schleiferiaceae bacterium]